MMLLVFITCVLGWIGVGMWFNRNRTFYRLGGLLMMSVLTYMSFEIMMWSFQLSLPYMMVIGLIPVVVVAYGFRYYDHHYRQLQKYKNDEKAKQNHRLSE